MRWPSLSKTQRAEELEGELEKVWIEATMEGHEEARTGAVRANNNIESVGR